MDEAEHRGFHRRIAYILFILLLVLFGGATFYHYVEKWRFLDALYFSAYTMTTVGYGDFTPKTDAGKIFTILYMFTGVGIALYSLTLLATHFIEVREEFWLKRLGRISGKITIPKTKNLLEKLKRVFRYDANKMPKEIYVKGRRGR